MRHTGLMAGLALAIALGGLSEARAQEGEGERGGMGQGMHHGMQGMAERFGEADADGDGKLSRDEMVARMTARAAGRIEARADRMIAHHDGDGDGMLTLEEMRSGMGGRMFERLDADGDGAISRGEFAKMREMRKRRRAATWRQTWRPKARQGAGRRGHPQPLLRQLSSPAPAARRL